MEVQLKLKALAEGFEVFNKAKQELTEVGNQGTLSAGNLAKGFIGAQLAMEALNTMVSITKQQFSSFVETGDKLNEMAEKTGITVDSLSALTFAANQSDTNIGSLSLALKFLSQNLIGAGEDTGKAAAAFQALNLNVDDLKNIGAEAALGKIAKEFQGLASENEKTALAMAIFGRSGTDLIPLLNKGEAGIEALKNKAKELGIVMGKDAAEGADALNDRMSQLKAVTDANWQQAFASALPEINKVFDALDIVRGKTEDGGGVLGEVLRNGLSIVADIVDGLMTNYEVIKDITGVQGESNGEMERGNALGTTFKTILEGVALLVALVKDTFTNVAGVILMVGGVIATALLAPLAAVHAAISTIVGIFNKELGDAGKAAAKELLQMGTAAVGAGAELVTAEGAATRLGNKLEKAKQQAEALKGVTKDVNASDARLGSRAKEAADAANPKRLTGFTGKVDKDDKEKAGKGDKTAELEAARFAALKQQLEAQIKLVRDALGREQRELDTAFAEGLTSIKDYYAKRASITQAGIDAEIALKEKEIAAAKKAEAAAGTDEKKKLQLSGQRAQLEADLTILQRKRADVAIDTERSTKKATDEYAKSIDDLKVKLTELTGVEQRTAAERRASIASQYELQLKKAQTEDKAAGTGTQKADLVTKIVNLESVRSDFAIVEREYQKMLADMQTALKDVDLDPGLTTIERAAKTDGVRASATIALESKRQELQTLIQQSQATLNLSDADVSALTEKTKVLGQEIQGLKPKVVDLGTAMRDTFQNAVGNELAAVISKTKTAKEAMIDLAKTMLSEFAKVASQNFIKQIFGGGGLGGGGGGGGLGGLLGKLFGFAEGGHVQGAGTGTSDSIPAMLSNGEFVQTANAVQHYGVDFMEAIRSLKFPKIDAGMMPKFAKGGLVGLQNQQVLQRFAKGGQVSTQRVAQAQRFATGGFVQAAQAAGDMAAPPSITVNIVNNGTPQRSTEQNFDIKSSVLTVMMEDLRTNGPVAQGINGITNTRRR